MQAYKSEVNREKFEKRLINCNNRSSSNTAGTNNMRVNQKVLEFEGESIQGPGVQTGKRVPNLAK